MTVRMRPEPADPALRSQAWGRRSVELARVWAWSPTWLVSPVPEQSWARAPAPGALLVSPPHRSPPGAQKMRRRTHECLSRAIYLVRRGSPNPIHGLYGFSAGRITGRRRLAPFSRIGHRPLCRCERLRRSGQPEAGHAADRSRDSVDDRPNGPWITPSGHARRDDRSGQPCRDRRRDARSGVR